MPDNQFPIGQLIHKRLTEDPVADSRDIYADLVTDPKASGFLASFEDPDAALAAIDSTLQGYRTFVGKEQEPTNWKELLTPDKNTPGKLGRGLLKGLGNLVPKSLNDVATRGTIGAFPLGQAAMQIPGMLQQFGKAKEEYQGGNPAGAVGHAAAGMAPDGPLLAGIGETIGEGNVAEGVGELAGTAASPFALKGAGQLGGRIAQAAKKPGVGKTLANVGEVGLGAGLFSSGHPFMGWATAARGFHGLGKKLWPEKAAQATIKPPPISNRGAEIFAARKATPEKAQVSAPPIKFREPPKAPAEPKISKVPVPPIKFREPVTPKATPAKLVPPPPIRTTSSDVIKKVLGGKEQKTTKPFHFEPNPKIKKKITSDIRWPRRNALTGRFESDA